MAPVTSEQRVLVLGGISSGKSRLAERMLADTSGERRYLATGRPDPADPDWQRRIAEHQRRRGDDWVTVDCSSDPDALLTALAEAPAGSAVLVDDLGGWAGLLLERAGGTADEPEPGTASGTPAAEPGDDAGTDPLAAAPDRLAAAVADSPADTVVLVSPEAGLSVVPATRVGRRFADLLGTVNQAVAARCGRVALVVAGRVVWLPASADGAAAPAGTAAGVVPAPGTASRAGDGSEPDAAADTHATADTQAAAGTEAAAGTAAPDEPVDIGPAEPDDDIIGIRPPDRIAITAAEERLAALATGGAGLGALAEPVAWVLGAGDRTGEWDSIRVVLVGADHGGGARAGATPAADTIEAVRAGTAPLARLADRYGADITVADLAAAGFTEPTPAMESTDVLTAEQVDTAFELGRSLAERAADEGVQVLVPAACGAGVGAASAAVLATATGNEPAGLLDRVVGVGGRLDDAAWIARCVAARDALHRVRLRSRDTRSLLAMLGGPDLAALTGLVIGAAIRQVPVLIDNAASATAAILARDLAPSSPWWCLIPDHGRSPAVRTVADLLGFEPVLDLGLGLGDGCTALTAIGVLQPALALAGTLDGAGDAQPVHA